MDAPDELEDSARASSATLTHRLSRGVRITIALLTFALLASLVGTIWLALALREANGVIENQDDTISELNTIIDTKEEFGAAMNDLLEEAAHFDGVPMGALVPFSRYDELARAAWTERRSPESVRGLSAKAGAYREELRALREHADDERASNESGTHAETVIDERGRGFVRVVYADADALCGSNVIGCVTGQDPYTVHLDHDDLSHPSVDAWGEEFVALHEFAHVLQFTNAAATDDALDAFGDDREFMADCYAFEALDAWSLNRRVWVSATQYWDASYGYGRVCTEAQREVIRGWAHAIGVTYRSVSQ